MLHNNKLYFSLRPRKESKERKEVLAVLSSEESDYSSGTVFSPPPPRRSLRFLPDEDPIVVGAILGALSNVNNLKEKWYFMLLIHNQLIYNNVYIQ